jgi:hypothetical protein
MPIFEALRNINVGTLHGSLELDIQEVNANKSQRLLSFRVHIIKNTGEFSPKNQRFFKTHGGNRSPCTFVKANPNSALVIFFQTVTGSRKCFLSKPCQQRKLF